MDVISQDKKTELPYDRYMWGIVIKESRAKPGYKGALIVATEIGTYKRYVMARYEDEQYARYELAMIRMEAEEGGIRTHRIRKDSALNKMILGE